MKKLFMLPLVAALGCSVLSTTSCEKEEYDLNDLKNSGVCIQTSLAAPLAKFHATLGDIFNMESISGNLTKLDGTALNLKDVERDEIAKLFPLPIDVEKTKFHCVNYIDDIDFQKTFGEESVVSALDSLVIIIDVKSSLPFDINLGFGFTDEVVPEVETPEIYPETLHQSDGVTACTDGKTVVEKSLYFKYGNIIEYIAEAKTMKIELSFEVPIEKLLEVTLSQDQFLDVKVKAFLQGNFDTNEF